MSKLNRVIISGGGTGGHIYPAIAIANTIKEQNPGVEIFFVGAEGRMEMEKVPKAGYEIIGLPIMGIQRRFTLKNLKVPFMLLFSLIKAGSIIKKFKPEVVIGVGGYASGPLLWRASHLGVPSVIQEQNSYAGVTNKLLAKHAKAICVAYPGMEKYFPKSVLKFTGNPVRKDLLNVATKREQALVHFGLRTAKKTILVIGGSLGARTLNDSIKGSLPNIINEDVQLIWQTGKFYHKACKAVVDEVNSPLVYQNDFIYEMDLAYAAADVVISRAGALSVSELCIASKPSVLVPSPNVSEDHQTKNAMALVNENAAVLVKDKDALEKLIPTVLELIKDDSKQKELSQNIIKLAKPNAAEEIVAEINRVIA